MKINAYGKERISHKHYSLSDWRKGLKQFTNLFNQLTGFFQKIKKRYILYFSVFPVLLLTGSSESKYSKEIIEYIEVQNWAKDIVRDLGWGILKGLAKLLDGIYSAITTLITLDFVNDIPAISEFTNKVTPLAWTVLGLALVCGAIVLMVKPDKLKISEFARSIMLSTLLIVAMPFMIQSLNDFKDAGVNDMNVELGNEDNNTVGKTLLRSITVDIDSSRTEKTYLPDSTDPYLIKASTTLANQSPWLYKVVPVVSSDAEAKATARAYQQVYGMTEEKFEDLSKKLSKKNLLQTVNKNSPLSIANSGDENNDGDDMTLSDYKALLSDYIDKYVDEENAGEAGNGYNYVKLKEYEKNVFDSSTWFQTDEVLYAYQPDFFDGFLILLVSVAAVGFAGFKIAKLLFNLVFNQILLPIVIASDLQNSGRTKKFIQDMVGAYVIFIILLLLIKIYLDISTWAASTNFNTDSDVTNLVIRILILAGAGMGLIDGPDLVTRVIGIDAGIKSGMGAMVGAMGAARTIKGMGHTAVHTATAPFRGIGGLIKNGNPVSAFTNQTHARKMNDSQTKENWGNRKNSNTSNDTGLSNEPTSSSYSSSGGDDSGVSSQNASSSTAPSSNNSNPFANNPIAQREQSNANRMKLITKFSSSSQMPRTTGNYRAKPADTANYGDGFKMPLAPQTANSVSTNAASSAISAAEKSAVIAHIPKQSSSSVPAQSTSSIPSNSSSTAPVHSSSSAPAYSSNSTSVNSDNAPVSSAASPTITGQAAASSVISRSEGAPVPRNNMKASSTRSSAVQSSGRSSVQSSSMNSSRPASVSSPNRQNSGYSSSLNNSNIFKSNTVKATVNDTPVHSNTIQEVPAVKPKNMVASAPTSKGKGGN